MLRHIRMTPTNKEIPKAEGRIFGLLHDWIHPFYRYRIPHTPIPRERVCACAYPVFTLRSSQRSPYDEPTMLAAVQETVYVDSTGKSTSLPASALQGHARPTITSTTDVAPSASPTITTEGSMASNNRSNDAAAAAAAAVAASLATTAPSSSPASAFLSSFGHLPSLKARWVVRRRSGRLTNPPQSTETCYRCDICDGLQRPCDEETHADTAVARSTGTNTTATAAVKEEVVEEAVDEDEDEDEDPSGATTESSSDERYGYTTSTDIANTAMEDADVAELRRLDPFHVEVFGKPPWGALLRRAAREVQGQLNRCGLRSRDASRYAAQATANSEVARQAYRLWVRAEAQRVREEQRRSMQPAATTSTTTSSTVSASSPSPPSPFSSSLTQLTLSPAQRAIIRGKLDTLHIAAYLARYAVAAYGLPYELNFFTSARELTKLMAEPHSRYVCANSEEQLESMRRMLQGEEPDALLECVASRYSLRVGQPCWSLFLDHAAQRVVLSFRGSMTAADMVVDFMEGYANVMIEPTHSTATPDGSGLTSPTTPQRVCTAIPLGFYESIVEAGAQLLPILRTIHTQYGSYTLCVTGHSLGGIQASVFHLLYCGPWRASLHSSSLLLRRTKTPSCPSAAEVEAASFVESSAVSSRAAHVPFAKTITCTFAAAPVVEKRVVPQINAWLAEEEKRSGSRLIAMTHGMDLVTRLQVHSLKETFLKPYSIATAASDTPTGAACPNVPESTAAAATAPLLVNVDAAAVTDKSVVPVLAVPGSMYNVTAGTRRRYLLAVPLTATAVREQIVLSAEAVLQHFPCLYLRSLAELLNRYEAKWNSLKAATGQNPRSSATADSASTQ
ncbi:hypothetical protein ABB37_01413 [Leptomonas pyrrhocoris]|uniref:sn-1-specific diacylglycerol lipase n=1 Tax=Leptomonas pyrrhocoris TaxID=157538 RepID=A0A0M9G8Q1_LEPPY|nr:hypothetical protein ABB37_01413 [Leptomonas pyrrhocoris]KPA84977.1 hypothetical protein ABB37_01413 [Leptomonas pyrrhocoris]|eukprot:XP_015663416.1 hypothetical protein ABB37_01413 [Leptomonas pyrrhocoris]